MWQEIIKSRKFQHGERFTRYGIRKYKVGTASVAIAAGLLFVGGVSGFAQEADAENPGIEVTPPEAQGPEAETTDPMNQETPPAQDGEDQANGEVGEEAAHEQAGETETPDPKVFNKDEYEVSYLPAEGTAGQTVTIAAPTLKNKADGKVINAPEGTRFELGDNSGLPEGVKPQIDPTTGAITITIPETSKPEDTFIVSVVMTYLDSTTDTPVAVLKVAETQKTQDVSVNVQFVTLDRVFNRVPGAVAVATNKQTGETYRFVRTENETKIPHLDLPLGEYTLKIESVPENYLQGKVYQDWKTVIEEFTVKEGSNQGLTITFYELKEDNAQAYEPSYGTTKGNYNEEITTTAPTFNKWTADGTQALIDMKDVPLAQEGAFAIDRSTGFTRGQIDPQTGIITLSPEDTSVKSGELIVVPVVVTYEDGTKDYVQAHIVVSTIKDADKYEPQANPTDKELGQPTTKEDIEGAITIPDYPEDAEKPEITVEPSQLPDGTTEGKFEVDVVITYPDNSTDQIKVVVNVTDQRVDADKFGGDVVTHVIHKDLGVPTTTEDINKAVVLSPDTAYKGQIEVFPQGELPDGQVAGEFEVPVEVAFDDGSTVEATVRVIVAEEKVQVQHEGRIVEVDKDGNIIRELYVFLDPSEDLIYHTLSTHLGYLIDEDGYVVYDYERVVDEETGMVKWLYKVVKVASGDMETPEKPEMPDTPEMPEKPEDTDQPETEKPEEKPAPQDPAMEEEMDKAAVLPETGEADNYALLSAAAVSVLAGLGLVARRREED